MAKFKEGDLVVCINDDYKCEPILGKICTIHKVIDNDGTYSVICDSAEECSNPSKWLVSEYQLELYTPQPRIQECLTDPDIDYEKISENPIYFEFVDIGKALNKLKDYEHKLMEQVKDVLTPVTEQEKYALRYVIGSRGSLSDKIHIGCIVGIAGDTVSIKFEDGTIAPFHKNRVYTTYTAALENFKLFHRIV